MVTAVNPKMTILRRGLSMIALPAWIITEIGDDFNEVMAYPKIDLPMYQPLRDSSTERLLPNINKIALNSITLMETNQRFIEAYMVGLNHEFARKLLWREYPTDQRGSYFRQFWSVGDTINSEGLSEDALKEKLYDIPEIHRWAPGSNLGDHNNRIPPGQPARTASRADHPRRAAAEVPQHGDLRPARQDGGWPSRSRLAYGGGGGQPPRSKTRTPLYTAQPADDIFFFGFDLTIDEVKGTGGDPGWYFVLQERPGEARFGLELSRTAPIETFDDVTWNDALPGIASGQFLTASTLASVALTEPSAVADPDKHDQWSDDEKVDPAAVSSARWAYVLFRQPVMVAVHADEMLAENEALAMADFTSAQSQLAAARAAQDAAQLAVTQAAARTRAGAGRAGSCDAADQPAGRLGRTRAACGCRGARSGSNRPPRRRSSDAARAGVVSATAAFAEFSTPQQNVSRLSDGSPFLLFPVRIETRFRTVSAVLRRPNIAVRLRQRISCWCGFIPMTAPSIRSSPCSRSRSWRTSKSYWMNIWRAGGVENDQRGAWSRLVAAHGSGRAGWLVDNFQPVNLPLSRRRPRPVMRSWSFRPPRRCPTRRLPRSQPTGRAFGSRTAMPPRLTPRMRP